MQNVDVKLEDLGKMLGDNDVDNENPVKGTGTEEDDEEEDDDLPRDFRKKGKKASPEEIND